MSETVLGTKEWFDAWMEGEKRCMSRGPFMYEDRFSRILAVAEDQYHDIISAADAWQIEDDDSEEGAREHKGTNAARRVKALVEQITGLRTSSGSPNPYLMPFRPLFAAP